MHDELTEKQIVQGLRDGDRKAWDALCRRYRDRVWTIVARLVGGDEPSVADVFQETFLAVARSGRNLEPDTRLWAWLSRIAHNQTALYWRKRYRDQAGGLGEATQATSPRDDPFEALRREETVQRIRVLLTEMNSDHVALLTSKYLDRLSVAEMVDLWGGTTESIRSRLARARRDFRRRYERMNPDEEDGAALLKKASPIEGEV